MKCPSFEMLMAFSDGELGGEDAERIEAHVGSCRRCASLVSSQARMEAAWRDSYREPSDGRFEMLEREMQSRYPARRSSLLQWALPVAAALLVAVAGIKYFGGGNRLSREAGPPMAPEAGFGSERSADGTLMQAEDILETGNLTAPEAVQEQSPAPPTVETGALAAPETVVVTGAADGFARFAEPGTSASGAQAGYGELLEIGTLEAQTEGMPVTGGDLSAAGRQGASAVGQQAAFGGGGASPQGGSGGFSAGGSISSSGMAGDAEADFDACETCVAGEQEESEDQEEQVSVLRDDSMGLETTRSCEECPAFSLSEAVSAETTGADDAAPESRTRALAGRFILFFDEEGVPSSPDSEVLDEAFPGWKDSLGDFCTDSMLVVSAEEISEMLLEH